MGVHLTKKGLCPEGDPDSHCMSQMPDTHYRADLNYTSLARIISFHIVLQSYSNYGGCVTSSAQYSLAWLGTVWFSSVCLSRLK